MVDEKVNINKTREPIPIEWYVPEGLMTSFTSNIVVQVIENVFKISFFEINPPIQLDESAPVPTKIRADCIARVIVTPDKLSSFIEVLQKQYKKYMSEKQTE